jgi:hypothetical protein
MFDSTFPQEDDELRASSEYVSMRRKIFDLIDTSTDKEYAYNLDP